MEDNKDNKKINISYLNNKISNFSLPSSLYEFRSTIKSLFQIPNGIDEIFIIYTREKKDKKKPKEIFVEVKMEDEYASLLQKINSSEIKNDIIYIETDRVPEEISREDSEKFEQEIENVINTHLKAAGERIKKELSRRREICPKSKIQKKTCSRCKNPIVGNIYRAVNDTAQKIYCEKCSYEPKVPMFVIH